MDIYTLDSSFSRDSVVSDYLSFIWTERPNDMGDFVLTFYPENTTLLNKLVPGAYLIHSDTNSPMVVETATVSLDDKGNAQVKAVGRTLECITLLQRHVPPQWTLSGWTGDLLEHLMDYIVGPDANTEIYSEYDKLNEVMTWGSGVPGPTYPTFWQDARTEQLTLFEQFKKYADVDKVTWTLSLSGYDIPLDLQWTTSTTRPDVIFSTDTGELVKTSYLQTNTDYKNIAYVQYKDTTNPNGVNGLNWLTVSKDGFSTTQKGLARRTMVVDATDLTIQDYDLADFVNILTARGWAGLAQANAMSAIDGEIPISSNYKIYQDYYLGDIVYVKGPYGVSQLARITEYIWTSDAQGMRSYPTFTLI